MGRGEGREEEGGEKENKLSVSLLLKQEKAGLHNAMRSADLALPPHRS